MTNISLNDPGPPLYAIVYDGSDTKIGEGPLHQLTSGVLKEAVDRIPSWSFSLPAVSNLVDTEMDDALRVEVYAAGQLVWKGLIDNVDTKETADGGAELVFEGETLGQELSWATTYMGAVINDQDPEDAMDILLETAENAWTTTKTGTGFQNVSNRYDNMSIWKAMTELALTQQSHIRISPIDREIEMFRGHEDSGIWLIKPGTPPGDPKWFGEQPWFGAISSLPSYKRDRRQIVNRIVPMGIDQENVVLDLSQSTRNTPYTIGELRKNRPSVTSSFFDLLTRGATDRQLQTGQLELVGPNTLVWIVVQCTTGNHAPNWIEIGGRQAQFHNVITSPGGNLITYWQSMTTGARALSLAKGVTQITLGWHSDGAGTEQYFISAVAFQDVRRVDCIAGFDDATFTSETNPDISFATFSESMGLSLVGYCTDSSALTAYVSSGAGQTEILHASRTHIDVKDFDLADNPAEGEFTFNANRSGVIWMLNVRGFTTYYIEDTTSQAAYGIRVQNVIVPGQRFVGGSDAEYEAAANTLYDYATTLLNRYKDEAFFYEVDVVSLPDFTDWQVGDTMHLFYQGLALNKVTNARVYININDDVEVVARERHWDSDGIKKWKLTLSTCCRLPASDDQLLANALGKLTAASTPFP